MQASGRGKGVKHLQGLWLCYFTSVYKKGKREKMRGNQ